MFSNDYDGLNREGSDVDPLCFQARLKDCLFLSDDVENLNCAIEHAWQDDVSTYSFHSHRATIGDTMMDTS